MEVVAVMTSSSDIWPSRKTTRSGLVHTDGRDGCGLPRLARVPTTNVTAPRTKTANDKTALERTARASGIAIGGRLPKSVARKDRVERRVHPRCVRIIARRQRKKLEEPTGCERTA